MASAAEGRGSTGGSTRTRRWPQLAPRRPDAAWPRTPAAWTTTGGGSLPTAVLRWPMAWASVRADLLMLHHHSTAADKPPPTVRGELPRLPCCDLRPGTPC